jgi:hypothetical protein
MIKEWGKQETNVKEVANRELAPLAGSSLQGNVRVATLLLSEAKGRARENKGGRLESLEGGCHSRSGNMGCVCSMHVLGKDLSRMSMGCRNMARLLLNRLHHIM